MKESKDILSLFEALSNYEIFTPPRVARDMLDLLPSELWSDPSIRLLDPCTKSGVFLREAFWRFHAGLAGAGAHRGHDGLEYNLNDAQQRTNHILKNMLYGIAISELTSYVARRTLYGVMEAHTDKQSASLDSFMQSDNFAQWGEAERSAFVGRNAFNEYYDHRLFQVESHKGFEAEGNIFYPTSEVRQKVLQEGVLFEDTYFPFIEAETKHRKILDIREGMMKFDVIIGNPPYQVNDGGGLGSNASAVYNVFVEAAKNLNPSYISMIIPSRWMQGGRGLDGFRSSMLSDKSIHTIVDFNDAKDCFPSVEIAGGICYFLRDSSYSGKCSYKYINKGKEQCNLRDLGEHDILIRDGIGLDIIKKIQTKESAADFFDVNVYPYWPFAFAHEKAFDEYAVTPTENKTLMFIGNSVSGKMKSCGGIGYINRSKIKRNTHLIDLHKVIVSKANGGALNSGSIISKPIYLPPNSVCTETYLVIGAFYNKDECDSLMRYVHTKFFRFCVFMRKISQNTTQATFKFVPNLKNIMDDESIYEYYGLSDIEKNHIESMIKPMD